MINSTNCETKTRTVGRIAMAMLCRYNIGALRLGCARLRWGLWIGCDALG